MITQSQINEILCRQLQLLAEESEKHPERLAELTSAMCSLTSLNSPLGWQLSQAVQK